MCVTGFYWVFLGSSHGKRVQCALKWVRVEWSTILFPFPRGPTCRYGSALRHWYRYIFYRYRRSISSITSAAVASAGRSISPATHCAPRSSFVLSSFFSLPFNLFFVFAFVFGVFFLVFARARRWKSIGRPSTSFFQQSWTKKGQVFFLTANFIFNGVLPSCRALFFSLFTQPTNHRPPILGNWEPINFFFLSTKAGTDWRANR